MSFSLVAQFGGYHVAAGSEGLVTVSGSYKLGLGTPTTTKLLRGCSTVKAMHRHLRGPSAERELREFTTARSPLLFTVHSPSRVHENSIVSQLATTRLSFLICGRAVAIPPHRSRYSPARILKAVLG
jgi:hypothetical protein